MGRSTSNNIYKRQQEKQHKDGRCDCTIAIKVFSNNNKKKKERRRHQRDIINGWPGVENKTRAGATDSFLFLIQRERKQ